MQRLSLAAIGTAAVALLATACTGSSPAPQANDDATKPVTITFWHGWSAPSEAAAIDANVKAFEAKHPNIKVKVVGNINDDKIKQALRAGGPNSPDVVSSFTTDNVGSFCTSNVFADLKPFLDKSGIDVDKTFPKALQDYTQYEGKRCALPLLNDAYGLYYNKDAFKAAGITAPPKTLSEFDKIAKQLTKEKGDTYSQLGFMPNFHGYESTTGHFAAMWNPTYLTPEGKSNLAGDPAFANMLKWQKNLVESLGGYAKLEKYRNTFGDEWGAKNPFHTGQTVMSIDGEWRLGMAKDAGVKFDIGVAPFPVPDDQADSYGKGYLAGTIIGIATPSTKQNAAWELVKYMTTDTEAVVNFSNGIRNIPSTLEALKSPNLKVDENFKVFLDIAQHPKSNTTPASPNGGAYQLTFQGFAYQHEAGKVPDLAAGLKKTDEQIDKDLAQSR
ncbi:ABC transporter substrate-binding protein [Kribbella sandramycini]|uniref:ABC transporter substrate-binding protein n=1 Tax=Kribbella sandramycini TaxID=60450 RepID=A0A7Y4P4S5_9ACTN|nr:ABC transporter substrate-binding protein [Kribbella sandramycini]MBB6566743.1 multiple sugar transport system substrate-binding protein [Kribbella sandramycini]NOL45529.1 ABC transporter substrate-binding protein [Kribbella sandramycini]